MADNVAITAGSGTTIATDDCTTGHAQVVKLAYSADGDRTHVPADANGMLVNLGTNNDVTVTNATAANLKAEVVGTGTFVAQINGAALTSLQLIDDAIVTNGAAESATAVLVAGSDGSNNRTLMTSSGGELHVVAPAPHGATDTHNPFNIAGSALAHGTNPTEVASGDVTSLYANVAGVLFTIGGHPNTQTIKHTTITTAVTDAAIVSTTEKIVVTRLTITLDNASTVFPTVLIGFGATNTPTTTGVLYSHGGFPAGGGMTIGDGSGILGVGATGDDLRVTTTGNATGNGLQITVSYFTIES